MPVLAQMLNSLVFVPLLSPRLAKGDCVSAICLKASETRFCSDHLRRIAFGTDKNKIVIHDVKAFLGKPIRDELVFLLRAWTNTTSASPLLPISNA